MSLGAEAWWAAMMGADQFEDGSLVIEDDTLDVNGGSTVNLRVKLGARPRSDVTVALSETSDLISLGESSLTFTRDNWDTYQSVTVTAGGNRQAITLLAAWYIAGGSFTASSPGVNDRPTIDNALKNIEAQDVRLSSVAARNTGRVDLGFAEGTQDLTGVELTSLFETDGSFTFTLGTHSLTVAMDGADTTEPYQFTPSNSAEVVAFHNAVSAETGNQAGSLVLRDFEAGDATISLSASGPAEYSGVSDSATVTVS